MTENWEPAEADVFDLLGGFEVEFRRLPDPLRPNLHPIRRVPLLLLLLDKMRGGRASWKAIHILSWAVRHSSDMDLLLRLRQGGEDPERPIVRIEPALDRAIDLAAGLGYVERVNGRTLSLTASGRRIVAEVNATTAFARERADLARMSKKFTQTEAEAILEWRVG